jgi:predicted phosphodiesterase
LFITLVAAGVFVSGHFYFQNQIQIADEQTQNNLEKAKYIFENIPIWHKKIQTSKDLKIGIITDTHVRASLSYSQLLPIHNFVADMREFQPEFVINLGDVIDGTHETDLQGMRELKVIKSELEKTQVPVHWVIGNHDLRAVTKEQFKEALELESLDQSFDIGEYRFIILDANYLRNGTPRSPDLEKRFIPGYLPEQTLEWLETQLATDKRTFIFMHQGSFNNKSIGDEDEKDDEDYAYEVEEMEDGDWVSGVYKRKQSIKNATKLRDIFDEYRVDAVFNGHMEARRYQKNNYTSYYSLTGTRKSEKFPQSYYELVIKKGIPDLTMYYKLQNEAEIVKEDFENESNIIQVRETHVKDAAGLEWNNGDWITVGGDRGLVFENNIRKYVNKHKLKGITMCNQKYYIGTENTNYLTVLDKNFKHLQNLMLDSIDKEVIVEGLACNSEHGLYVVTRNNIFEIDLEGKKLSTIQLLDENLSHADYYDDTLYIVSKKNHSVLIINEGVIVDSIPIKQDGKIGGIKASEQIINIIFNTQ